MMFLMIPNRNVDEFTKKYGNQKKGQNQINVNQEKHLLSVICIYRHWVDTNVSENTKYSPSTVESVSLSISFIRHVFFLKISKVLTSSDNVD